MYGGIDKMKNELLKLIQRSNISLEKLQKITGLDLQTIESLIHELEDEKLIFLNTSKRYEVVKDDYLVGVLEKTSKGSCYVRVDDQKIFISPDSLHTALKNDLVVVEKKYDNYGTIKGILKRKNNRLVCEVKEWHNKLVLVPFNGNCEIHLITSKELLKDC